MSRASSGGAALAFVLSALVPTKAWAQLGETHVVNAGFEYDSPVRSPLGGSLGFDIYRAGLTLPFEIVPKKAYLLGTLNYQYLHADGPMPLGLGSLHMLSLGPMLVVPFSQRWFGIVGTTYGIASDLAGPFSAHDLFVSGLALGMYALSPALTVGAGVQYDQRTGQLLPIPLGVLYWEPVPRFHIRSTLPQAAYVSWRPLHALTLELTGSLDGQRYNLSDRELDGHKGALAYSVIKLGGGARIHFSKFLHAELTGGVLVDRTFEGFLDGRSVGSGSIPAGPFVGVSLWLGTSGWREDMPPVQPPRKQSP